MTGPPADEDKQPRGTACDHAEAEACGCGTLSTEEYKATLKEMERSLEKTRREREVEKAYGTPIGTLLRELDAETPSRSEMLRQLNKSDEFEGSISRATLYSWLRRYDLY